MTRNGGDQGWLSVGWGSVVREEACQVSKRREGEAVERREVVV